MTKRAKKPPNTPSPTWPDAYVLQGKVRMTATIIDPEMYKKYVAAMHDWHKEMQEFLTKIKEREDANE